MASKNKYNRPISSALRFFLMGCITAPIFVMVAVALMTGFTMQATDQATNMAIACTIIIVYLLTPILFAVVPFLFNRHLSAASRSAEIAHYAYIRGLVSQPRPVHLSPIFTLRHENNQIATVSTVVGSGWQYNDLDVTVIGTLRRWEYIKYHSFYSVLEIPLPRLLPNVFFDSLKNNALSMLYMLDANQRLSLDGDFDKYFATYVPVGYKIDTLSFVSPEVMQALIGASEYDIEIYGDSLYLYSDVIAIDSIDSMATKGIAVYSSLMNNIMSYSDSRLPKDTSHVSVALGGRDLSTNRLQMIRAAMLIAATLFMFFAVLVRLWLSHRQTSALGNFFVLAVMIPAFMIVAFSVWRLVYIAKHRLKS